MAGAVKHALRSKKTYGNNNVVFSKFEYKASKIQDVRKLKTLEKKHPILERLTSLFKRHQDR